MKILTKIFLGFLTALLILAATCYIYVRLNGRELVTGSLSQAFNTPVTVDDIHFLFPFGIRISRLKVTGKMEVKDVQLQMGIPDFFHQRWHILFMNLSEPVMNIQRTKDLRFVVENRAPIPVPSPTKTQAEISAEHADGQGLKAVPQEKKKFGSLRLMVDYLLVEGGKVDFTDYSRDKDFHLTVQDVKLKARGVAVPSEVVDTRFDLAAVVVKEDSPFSGSRIETRGWANFKKKNMQAKVDVFDREGKSALGARLESKNNDMRVRGRIQMKNFIAKSEIKLNSSSVKDFLFSALRSSEVEIAADFDFRTRMDNFQIDSIAFSGNLGYQPPVSSSAQEAKEKTEPSADTELKKP